MNKFNSQVVNTLLIVISGGLLLFLIAMEEKDRVYLLILGIVLLMFGLYRATNHWVYTEENKNKGENSFEENNKIDKKEKNDKTRR
ncbi:MAG TPA: hypothetical protein VFI78_04000 [Salinimicrobium sp.]|nr:hypothetical protein [Salinimicrobium sp.]